MVLHSLEVDATISGWLHLQGSTHSQGSFTKEWGTTSCTVHGLFELYAAEVGYGCCHTGPSNLTSTPARPDTIPKHASDLTNSATDMLRNRTLIRTTP